MEAGTMIPKRHRGMLLSILELQEVTVEDIMVPRNEVVGINLDDDWGEIYAQITNSAYSKLLVYRDTVDNVVGILQLRKVVGTLAKKGHLDREDLKDLIREPYFVPENTPLNTQLVNFQKQRRRRALVVDEYGDLLGMVTLEDILEEIVGEFTSDPSSPGKDIDKQPDGSYLVEGTTSIRTLNRLLNWQLPVDGPRTLNGLIMEYLESIPEPGTGLTISGHRVEIVKTADRRVKTARIWSAAG
jgi:Mg2+/Co2+ transporter CorB